MPKANTSTGNLMISVFDGRRQPFSSSPRLLIRVIDGNQDTQVNKFRKGPNIAVRNLPFFDNFGDDYTVLTSADKYNSAGFRPVKLLQNAWQHVDLMLLRKNAGFNFSLANWNTLAVSHPILSQLLAAGTDSGTAAKARYDDLLENRSEPSRDSLTSQRPWRRFYCLLARRLIISRSWSGVTWRKTDSLPLPMGNW